MCLVNAGRPRLWLYKSTETCSFQPTVEQKEDYSRLVYFVLAFRAFFILLSVELKGRVR